MKLLPKDLRHDGFDLHQIYRDGIIAIYRQIKGRIESYEVIRIKEVKEKMLFGRKIDAHEAYPASEEWGERGWSYNTLDEARCRVKALELGILGPLKRPWSLKDTPTAINPNL